MDGFKGERSIKKWALKIPLDFYRVIIEYNL